MLEQPDDHANQEEQSIKIRILQVNLNKSEQAHLDIINEEVSKNYDIMLIQEPYATRLNAIRTPTNFSSVFPSNRFKEDTTTRSVIWVNKSLDTSNWMAISIPDTSDITAIQLKGEYGKITIFNIYNDCTHSRNEETLENYLRNRRNALANGEDTHMIWAGDFNRHHPLWDDDRDTRLFTRQVLREAEGIIDLIAEYDMEMALPKGIPTLQHMRSRNYSRPDNVFCSTTLRPYVVKCKVEAQLRPPSTDHFPILTQIDLPQSRIPPDPSFNFRAADWDEFRQALANRLNLMPRPEPIEDVQQLERMGSDLTRALQETIEEKIKRSKPRPDARRWWNSDLKKMRKELNKLRAVSYKNRIDTHHISHSELKRKSKIYGNAIISAKKAHWEEYLENLIGDDIWTTNKYIKNPVGDGGVSRIPTIRARNENGEETATNDNEEKARIFAKAFFPPPPNGIDVNAVQVYPDPLPDPPPPTKQQIERTIRRLPSYKAPGPDGIPNIVLQKSFDMIADHLLYIYQAILRLGVFYDPWKEFTTIVLKKPDLNINIIILYIRRQVACYIGVKKKDDGPQLHCISSTEA